MTQEQLDRLAAGLESSLKPYIDDLVARAVAEIPHRIQAELTSLIGVELRHQIREAVSQRVNVSVTVSDT